ncbi:adenine phosphoribosyltransferase [Candidatus Poribacteria bacterium]|nr:MAG: adenine phosphoribosyltransferase [Candidatus Poribacteria bacterium]
MDDLTKFIRTVPDFPKPGIPFKDITPLLANAPVFNAVIEVYANYYKDKAVDIIVGPESRGFIFASALAYRMAAGFVPVRKKGKLPYDTYEVNYELEYGNDTLTIHQDAFPQGSRILICDDLLATGGTIAATIELVEKLGGDIAGIALLIELTELNGREKVKDIPIFSIFEF